MGYHKRKIEKGVLGESSKIREELEELQDAEQQGVKILIYCELADLYGALRECAARHGMSMRHLEQMADLTESAFKDGER